LIKAFLSRWNHFFLLNDFLSCSILKLLFEGQFRQFFFQKRSKGKLKRFEIAPKKQRKCGEQTDSVQRYQDVSEIEWDNIRLISQVIKTEIIKNTRNSA